MRAAAAARHQRFVQTAAERHQQRRGGTAVPLEGDAPAKAQRQHQVQRDVAPQQEQAALEKEVDRTGRAARGRQRGEDQEDPVHTDGKWMRSEGNKRKTIEEEEEKRACSGKP